MRGKLTRRDLLRGAAYGGVGAAIGLSCASCRANQQAATTAGEGAAAPADPTARARVVVVRRNGALDEQGRTSLRAVREMLDEAMARLDSDTGTAASAWSSRFVATDRVGLKGNVMMNHVRPEILLAIHDSLVEHVGIDTGNVLAWDRGQGARGREQLALADRDWPRDPLLTFDANSVSRVCSEWATALINVPSLKCHWLSGVAIGLKNWCGAVTGISVQDGQGTVFQFHGDSCAGLGQFEALPALGGKRRLTVVDAMEPYYEKGPQVDPEFFHPYGGLIVGTDPVAVDTVGTMLLQAIRDQAAGAPSPISPPPKHVGLAETKYGLGVSDPARIDIVRLGDADGMLV
jgi:hypothetical protein